MVGHIPQSDLFFCDVLVFECSSRMLETWIQFSAWENSDCNLLLSIEISVQGAGCSALGAVSSTAVSFTGHLIRMLE